MLAYKYTARGLKKEIIMARTKKDFSSNKNKLVKIALETFIENGYDNTTISTLQKKFGLTKGGMYHYFSSKEEILDAVIEYGLRQSAEEMALEIKNIPLEQRILYFFFSSNKNEFANNLFKYSRNSQSSIVAYRFREKFIEILGPSLKDIVNQYIEAGIYKSQFPDEMVEVCLVLVIAITEEGILPKVDRHHQKKRIDNFLDLWCKCMEPTVEHMQELHQRLYELIND